MKMLSAIFRELMGLFVDDGLLAIEIVVVVAIAALVSYQFPAKSLVTGAILIFGCLGALFVNVQRAKRS
jgi:UDP-N-acetylmuramyl pentapeptide phosphotransferase/UDP-N-acetylglucosamine-1-phosphate transferase